ncbi:FtsW/RodA/SpoVE family cell cycle protein [Synechococcus sp. H55.7]|uniref:FtsW/RodA/SpoVE family cell cycle protein n=1 Tax=unclassified Synechococcus TaxID=2626047 RepID=UPI0039C17340
MATISEPAAKPSRDPWNAEARWLRWLTLVWLALGLMMLFSASYPVAQRISGDGLYFFRRQLVWAGLGLSCFSALVRIPLRRWFPWAGILCLVGVGLVWATQVPGLGVSRLEASRWLDLKVIPIIQPSELLKPLLVLQGAWVFGRWFHHPLWFRVLWVGIFAFALLGILAQPNLGTTAICGLTLWVMAWAAGIPAFSLLATAGLGILATVASILSKDYQRRRILAFLDPWGNAQGDGYQLVQSLLAIGSGGLWGKGYGLSQQKLFYLPIQYTDFIFSVYAEEFGLAGSLFFLGLLTFYTLLGWRVMGRCRELPIRLVACGCLMFLVGQSLMNIGVVTGILPTTGVPLPLFSHGGSSILAGLITAGLLVRAAREAG